MLDKLEAVNLMLEAIDEDPVSSLSSDLPDFKKAERFLDRVTREVLQAGWHSNTDFDMELTPDASKRIPLPENALRVDSSGRHGYRDVVPRAISGEMFLYDKDKNTFEFSDKLIVDIVWAFNFDDLTFQLRNFIAHYAAVKFQKSEMSSVALDKFLIENADTAWNTLIDAEADAEDSNPLRDNPDLCWATYRNTYRYRSR